ncbi:hypothetical protein [Candidatus Vallotia cooleyia]|nr:hypothetical protein [Candidatus Vallotia cooleyia]
MLRVGASLMAEMGSSARAGPFVSTLAVAAVVVKVRNTGFI